MTYQIRQREAELRGEQRGRTSEKTEIAKKMLAKKMPIELIAELTGLSLSDIKALETRKAN